MALQNFSGLFLPHPPIGLTEWRATPGTGNLLLDAAGEKAVWVFRAPKTGTLERIGFRLNVVTTAEDLKVSFQNVDPATGFPDGAIDQYRIIPSASVISNTWVDTGIITDTGADGGTKRSVTIGDPVAVVIEFNSAVGNLNISMKSVDAAGEWFLNSAYCLLYTGSWALQSAFAPQTVIKYDDGSYPYLPSILPTMTTTVVNLGSTSDPDEIGAYFQLPFPCAVSQAGACGDFDGDFDLVLYDSDGSTPLGTISVDKDIRGVTGSSGGVYPFATPITLTKATNYRIVVKPTTATTIALRYITVNSAAFMEHLDGGIAFYWTQRTNGGGWSQDTTKRPWIFLVISALDDGVGGGGAGISRGRVQGDM